MGISASLHGFELDEAQRSVLPRFQRLCEELAALDRSDAPLRRLLARKRLVKGLYLWGGVGRGKSFLMDSFFNVAPVRRKTRAHFHRFMQDIHQQLAALQGQSDPLATIAKGIAREARLLCLDEFLVTDIADAMLMRRLLEGLVAEGVVLVTTSNTQPDELYLERSAARSIPARDRSPETTSRGGQRGRRPGLSPAGAGEARRLSSVRSRKPPIGAWRRSSSAIARHEGDAGTTVEVDGRMLAARRVASGVAWFDFAELCQKPRGQVDFIEDFAPLPHGAGLRHSAHVRRRA